MKPKTIKHGQPSWRLSTSTVEAFVTETGGHLGPVTFRLGGKTIRPFDLAPWARERLPSGIPPILKVMRGDFFCLPFGGNETVFQGESHPPHGETANARWRHVESAPGYLHLRLHTRVRTGSVDKHVWLDRSHGVVYQRHIVSGMSGPMNFGHHAILQFPLARRSGLISTSRFAWGEVSPVPLERPEQRGYSCLRAGARFSSLSRVPTVTGTPADLSAYPDRKGFEDLVMLVGNPRQSLAWTAVAFPKEGYAWFALKDPRVLTNTVFWHSNGGRHYPPWNGRHLGALGLEEVTSYFHYGLAESARPNDISARGHSTCRLLDPEVPLVVPYIMAVVRIPAGFDHVATIKPVAGKPGVRLISRSGKSVECGLDVSFLRTVSAPHAEA